MRILLAFVTMVAVIMAVSNLFSGAFGASVVPLAVAAVAGFFLWRNLNDPEVDSRQGERATVTYSLDRPPGLPADGTYAQLKVVGAAWDVVLDRQPERKDFEIYGTPQRAWVWRDLDGMPMKMRLMDSPTIQRWPVVAATPLPASEGLRT